MHHANTLLSALHSAQHGNCAQRLKPIQRERPTHTLRYDRRSHRRGVGTGGALLDSVSRSRRVPSPILCWQCHRVYALAMAGDETQHRTSEVESSRAEELESRATMPTCSSL